MCLLYTITKFQWHSTISTYFGGWLIHTGQLSWPWINSTCLSSPSWDQCHHGNGKGTREYAHTSPSLCHILTISRSKSPNQRAGNTLLPLKWRVKEIRNNHLKYYIIWHLLRKLELIKSAKLFLFCFVNIFQINALLWDLNVILIFLML